MKLMAYNEDETSKEVDALWFDGYSVGERQLEGLPIKITLNSANEFVISADWPKGLDKNYWTEKAAQYVRDMADDSFSTNPACDNDDGWIQG